MGGGLPTSGVLMKDITLTGSDDVTVIVKSNTNTMYTDTTREFDALPSNDRILYQFIFPLNTQVSADTTTYTTPKKSTYVFSDGSSLIKIGNQFTKNVTSGTITIRPPAVFESSLPDSSLGELSMADIAKDSPFHSLLLVVYKLFMDMIPIFIFWALFVSISCWVKVKAEYLYPSDVTRYPFVFYQENVPVYHPFKSDGNDVCFEIPKEKIKIPMRDQNEYFNTLENLPADLKEIINAIYPDMLKMNPDRLHPLSQYLLNNCSKKDKCTWDYIVYFLLTIVLNNYLYCNTVISFIHSMAYMTYDLVISKIPSPLSVILFTFVLYFMFIGVGAMNDKVMRQFGIHLEKETSISAILLNQFYRLLITILSCCMSLILPLCSIFVITTLLATAYTVIMTLFGAVNMSLGIMAFFTLSFSITSYVLIGTRLAEGMNPLELINSLFSQQFSVSTFFSLFGLTIPIMMGISYAVYIGVMLFFTFFQFLKLKDVIEKLRSSSASIVMMALLLLMMHVKEVLGNSFTMMTFMIILVIGYYVSTLMDKKGLNSPSNLNTNERVPENKSSA
jgi:hypothetical protein